MITKDKNKKKEYCRILGLTENELDFYLTLVKLGKCSVQKAAKEMEIFRSSAYILVDSLAKKGLISQEFKKYGRNLIPEEPKILKRLIKEQESKIKKIKSEIEDKIPDLLGQFEKARKDPIIKVYEGVEGLKAIHEDILETGKTMYCYPRLDTALKVLPLDFQLDWILKRINKGIMAKGICLDTPAAQLVLRKSKEKARGKGELREMRILPDPLREMISGEKILYGNKVAYMTYDKKIIGVVIEHEEIAQVEKKHFNILWRVSLPYKY